MIVKCRDASTLWGSTVYSLHPTTESDATHLVIYGDGCFTFCNACDARSCPHTEAVASAVRDGRALPAHVLES